MLSSTYTNRGGGRVSLFRSRTLDMLISAGACAGSISDGTFHLAKHKGIAPEVGGGFLGLPAGEPS